MKKKHNFFKVKKKELTDQEKKSFKQFRNMLLVEIVILLVAFSILFFVGALNGL